MPDLVLRVLLDDFVIVLTILGVCMLWLVLRSSMYLFISLMDLLRFACISLYWLKWRRYSVLRYLSLVSFHLDRLAAGMVRKHGDAPVDSICWAMLLIVDFRRDTAWDDDSANVTSSYWMGTVFFPFLR